MILYFSAAGVPISWSLTAIFDSAYGIACAAAENWSKNDDPQLVIQIEDGKVKRSDIYWDGDDYKTKQKPDDFLVLQCRDRTFRLNKKTIKLAEKEIRRLLVEIGYFIPRAEWERRYPAQVLISARFAEFRELEKAARDAGERLSYSDRMVLFMEMPEDWQLPYDVEQRADRFGISAIKDGHEDPTSGTTWDTKEQAENACRMLNSGWTWDETQILMQPEPRP